MKNKIPTITELRIVPSMSVNRDSTLTKWLVKDRQLVYKDQTIAIFESVGWELEYQSESDGIIIQTILEGEQILSGTIFCVIKSYRSNSHIL
ncbi:hypothetical protein HYN48_13875 [Flavobacterium magnum]|uniref:Lipoyl-binding domain-containing protein n=1 Tax=Flavobacterium magnum TaxID=2162713 RepID=A0A2S0RGM4_9FLAO|nr:hypothetical protein [Flavobacterium magnum]AWA31087.1 hypothetical protein HYN48_13875 [Flavobacterium magnum]